MNNRRGIRSREEILQVASRLMAERGYAATTVSVLSEETEMPRSAIYHHFSSKAGLLSAVMDRGMHDFFDATRAAHADPPRGGTHRERLDWYLQRTADVVTSRQDFLRLHLILLMSAEAEETEIAALIDQVRRDGRAYVNHIIASSFRDQGEAVAQAVADDLQYFVVAGFDGAFIAMQAHPTRSMADDMHRLAEAAAALGEGRVMSLKASA